MPDNAENFCQSCGACCSYSANWPRFTIEDDAALDLIPAKYVNARQSGMRCDGDRCAALTGDVGVATSCAIYAERPAPMYEQGNALLDDMKSSSLQRVQLERVDLFCAQARLALATCVLDRPKAAERLRVAEALARRLEREHMPSAAPASLLIQGAILAQRGDIVASRRARKSA